MKLSLRLLPIFCIFSFSIAYSQSNGLTVYNILQENCVQCHSNGSPAANLDFEGSGATIEAKWTNVFNTSLVARVPENSYAKDKGYKIVEPGRPDLSFLFRKIVGDFEPTITLSAEAGGAMPQNNPGGLSEIEKEKIRQWILFGANKDGISYNEAVVEDYYTNGGGEAFPDGAPEAPSANEGFQIKMGPFFLAPGGEPGDELEFFQKYALNLEDDLEVIRLDSKFSGSSHHFIAYSYDFPSAANNIPDGLRLNSFHNNVSLVMAVQEQSDIRLPDGAAFMWDNDLILDLNSHYINYQLNEPYKSEVYLNVYTQEAGTAAQEMFTDLEANTNIFIPNNEEDIVISDRITAPFLGDIYMWGMMGHTHKYGTGYKVWKRENGVKTDLIYDGACPEAVPNCVFPDFDYQHIPFRYFDEFLPINMGSTNGLEHEASWLNDGPNSVTFGATSDDEMMVLVLMYLKSTDGVTIVSTEAPTLAAEAIEVFPNPMSDYTEFLIKEKSSELRHLQLYDNLGRLIFASEDWSNYFRLAKGDLESGIYYYQIVEDGQNIATGKLMVN